MVLVFDIETSVPGDRPDPEKDIFKYMGAYEYETDTYHFLEDPQEIRNLFKKHRVIIGYNSYNYDEPILKRFGLMRYRHLHIDLIEVIKKRQDVLGCIYQSKSLKNMAKFFGLKQDKSELDYNLLKKENLSDDEYNLIKKYTLQDIKVTKELFDKLSAHFETFKEFMSKDDIRNYKWLSCTISVYAYKVICNLVGMKEEYSNNPQHIKFEGGFVAEPIQKEAHEDIYCLDFNSLYPHNMIQGNLFNHKCKCCNDDEKWKGNELFPIQGRYCSKKTGMIEKKLQEMYDKRRELKKNKDKREYALKITLNTLYGLTGNPSFKAIYNYDTASDCTLIARRCCKLARKKFKEAGYLVLYSDTDSVFLQDPFKDNQRLMMVKNSIISEIKKNLPFPTETFDMGIDAEIEHIWFREKNNRFLKKHYLYVTKQKKMVVKGLPMIKNDSSGIGYKIFKKYMEEEIIDGNMKFTYQQIKEWVKELLTKDINLATRRFKVSIFESYKNENQIQAQISKKYGPGHHLLLPNKYLGVGKSIKYCKVKEYQDKGMTINSLILNKFWSEMEFFSNYIPNKYNVNSSSKNRNQVRLDAWTTM